MQTLLRIPRVIVGIGKKKSSLYSDIEKGLFTRPVKIGARASAWPENEVAAINAARIAGMSDDEIRQLVASLHEARKGLDRGVQS